MITIRDVADPAGVSVATVSGCSITARWSVPSTREAVMKAVSSWIIGKFTESRRWQLG
ncbi:LacI family DNA-binding transcriptional regulator [Shigella flexneri]